MDDNREERLQHIFEVSLRRMSKVLLRPVTEAVMVADLGIHGNVTFRSNNAPKGALLASGVANEFNRIEEHPKISVVNQCSTCFGENAFCPVCFGSNEVVRVARI